jgi:hypothetical protein
MLYVPGNSWGSIEDSESAPNSFQAITTTTSSSDPSGWTEVIASTTNDCYELTVIANTTAQSGAQRQVLLTLATGAASSEVVLIQDLMVSHCGGPAHPPRVYYVPIYLPAGTRISAQARGDHASTTTLDIALVTRGRPSNPAQILTCQGVETVGTRSGSASAATFSLNSSSGTWGAWTSIGTAAKPCKAWALGVSTTDGAFSQGNSFWFELGVGDGTNMHVIDRLTTWGNTNTEILGWAMQRGFVEYSTPAGAALYVRGMLGGANDTTGWSAFAYGAY